MNRGKQPFLRIYWPLRYGRFDPRVARLMIGDNHGGIIVNVCTAHGAGIEVPFTTSIMDVQKVPPSTVAYQTAMKASQYMWVF
jgi:hypothetical protein